MTVWKVSERRTCRVFQNHRSSQRYQSTRHDRTDLKKRIKEIAETRVRYSYRRIPVLQLRNKTPKRHMKAKLRDDRKDALAVVDTFSRFTPVIDARFSYKGEDVIKTLDQVYKVFGYPKSIRADNDPEFISRDLDL